MKKYLLYSLLGATALFTAACDEDFNEDVVPPQEWEQEEAIILPGLTATGAVDLNLGKVEGDSAVAFTTTLDGSALPEGAYVSNFRVTFTAQKEDAKSVTLPAGKTGNIATQSLQEMIENDFGKRPIVRKYDAVVYADIMTNGQASLLKSETTFSAAPKAPFISSGYYLIGNICDWNPDGMIAFTHSDKDVYEVPIFNLTFTIQNDNSYWKIIPQSNVDAGDPWRTGTEGVVGVKVDGDPSLEGSLISGEGVNAGKIEKAGMYRMKINMMDYTFSITAIAPEYYLVGALQGWNADPVKGMICMLYPKDAMHHSFTTKFEGDGNLKIWLGSEFGLWDKAMGTAVDGDQSPEGKIGGNGAIKCPETDAYYSFEADFATNTYKWTKLENQNPTAYNQIGLIGVNGDWNKDKVMTQAAPHNWFFKDLKIEKDGDLKFRANGAWDVDWGGKFNIADNNSGISEKKGANIKIPAGTYNVFFNDITGEFVFKKM